MGELKWSPTTLKLKALRTDKSLQVRVGSLHRGTLRSLQGAYSRDEPVEPVRVARISRALYIVDGHHRVEAAGLEGLCELDVLVSVMTLEEAQNFAITANVTHGKNMSRDDKRRAWELYVHLGRHLRDDGVAKASRTISAELKGLYSYETVRRKLKELQVEIDEEREYPSGKFTWGWNDHGADEDDLGELGGFGSSGEPGDPLEASRLREALEHLEGIRELWASLEDNSRAKVIGVLRSLVELASEGNDLADVGERIALDI